MIKSQFCKMHTEDMPVNYHTLIKNEVNLIVKQRKQQGNDLKGKKALSTIKEFEGMHGGGKKESKTHTRRSKAGVKLQKLMILLDQNPGDVLKHQFCNKNIAVNSPDNKW